MGQAVIHNKFGEGTVIAFEGSGEHTRVHVNFLDAGAKWLVLAYANLQAPIGAPPMSTPTRIQLDTRQGYLAGLGWRPGRRATRAVLHGWLDNAASFVPLAPLLDRLDLVALDLPGHGLSEHRHCTTRYHFIDYLFNVDAALDALGWEDCHLVGHSLGAAISAVYGAGAPERVRSIVLLDSIGPISATAETQAGRLRRSLVKNRRGTSRVRRFESIDDMVKARRTVSDLSEAAARLICERAARESTDTMNGAAIPP